MAINILLVEDNPGDRRLIQEALNAADGGRFKVDWSDRLASGLKKLSARKPDAAILDLTLPDSQGLDTFARVYAQAPDVPVIVLTGLKDEELAVQAVRAGAQDYLVKSEVAGGTLVRALLYGIERHRAEAARARLAAIVESSDDAIIGTDPEGTIVSWNSSAERMLGFTAREALGQSISIIIPPDRSQELVRVEDLSRQGGAAIRTETVRLRKDGTRVDVSVSVSPIRDASGRIVGISGILRDITERNRAEQRFRDLLEAAPDAMVVVNQEGKIALVNAKVKDLFGYEREELLGQSYDLLMPRRFRGAHLTDYRRFLGPPRARPRGAGLELCGLRKDGSEFPAAITLSPLATGEGTLLIGAVRDVSPWKRAEEEIRQLSGRLLLAQEEERRRVARELHDSTAQALAAIAINLSVVQNSARMGEEARKCLASAIEMATECSDEIRDLSHLLHPLVLDEQDLSSALQWYVDRFSRHAGITVDLKVSPELGRFSKETETALFRIVQEGLTNVFRHSGSARAQVELVRDSQEVILQIIDEGKGLGPAATAQRLGAQAGSGIGILSMRERARQIGGQFRITSGDKGTAIRVTFPYLAPKSEP